MPQLPATRGFFCSSLAGEALSGCSGLSLALAVAAQNGDPSAAANHQGTAATPSGSHRLGYSYITTALQVRSPPAQVQALHACWPRCCSPGEPQPALMRPAAPTWTARPVFVTETTEKHDVQGMAAWWQVWQMQWAPTHAGGERARARQEGGRGRLCCKELSGKSEQPYGSWPLARCTK